MTTNFRGLAPAVLLAGLALGLGVSAAGWEMGRAVRDYRAAERYVTVKGLSERAVKANRATWTISFNVAADQFDALQDAVDRSQHEIESFLGRQGFAPKALEVEQTVVNDRDANPYAVPNQGPRFSARGGVVVRTTDVDRVDRASRAVNDLVRQGLLLEPTRPTYAFTLLNDIKPAMLAEATKAARTAADEFARASQSSVGSIRRASQGVFSITGEDGETEHGGPFTLAKQVRVVTTVDFFLE